MRFALKYEVKLYLSVEDSRNQTCFFVVAKIEFSSQHGDCTVLHTNSAQSPECVIGEILGTVFI